MDSHGPEWSGTIVGLALLGVLYSALHAGGHWFESSTAHQTAEHTPHLYLEGLTSSANLYWKSGAGLPGGVPLS